MRGGTEMIWRHKQDEDSFETKQELAVAAITSLYNAVPESRKLRSALRWAIDILEKAKPEEET